MTDRTPAQLRQDRICEIARLKTLKSKLCAIIASADECNAADQNSRVGNLANDIECLAHDIGMAGSRLFAAADALRVIEWETAQRQAEHDFAPALRLMVQTIASASPANQDSQERV